MWFQWIMLNFVEKIGWIIVAFIGIIILINPMLYGPVIRLFTREPPTPPTKLEVLHVSHDTALIQWEAPDSDGGSPITAYIVEISDSSNAPYHEVAKVDGMTNKYQINDLMETHGYSVRVTAENRYGKSEPIVSWLITGVKVMPPTSPSSLEVLRVTHNKAHIKWEAPESDGGSPITGYIVEMSGGSNKPYYKVTEVAANSDNCELNQLMESRGYCIRVVAKNMHGESQPVVVGLITSKKGGAEYLKYVGGALLGGAIAAAAAPVAVPAALAAAGFTASGITAGSAAATAMSAYGGSVVSGSLLATAQSIGAAGLGALGTAVSGTVGAVAGSVMGLIGLRSEENQYQINCN